jgi:MFS transporter, SET family, sugar efflux transporter
MFMVISVNFMNTPLFIVNDLHGSYTNVGLVVSICAGLEIPIMLVLGAVGRKMSNQLLMIYGCFIAVMYYIILGLSSEVWHLIVAQLLQATVVAIVMGNGLSYFNDLLPNSPGMAATFYTNASIIGRLLGNISGGFIAQTAGFRNVYWFCLVLVVLSLLILRKIRQQEVEIPVIIMKELERLFQIMGFEIRGILLNEGLNI